MSSLERFIYPPNNIFITATSNTASCLSFIAIVSEPTRNSGLAAVSSFHLLRTHCVYVYCVYVEEGMMWFSRNIFATAPDKRRVALLGCWTEPSNVLTILNVQCLLLLYDKLQLTCLVLQLCLLKIWTRHMKEICQLVLWRCHGWATLFYVPSHLATFDGDMHKVYLFRVLCDSLLTTFPPEKKLIKRSTTFTSMISLFCLLSPFLGHISTTSLVLHGVHFCAFLGPNCVWLVCLVCLFWFIFSHMVFFVRGNSRFFLFTSSSGICTILVITSFSVLFSVSLDTFIVMLESKFEK